LSLSDRLIVTFALRHVCSVGEGHVAVKALQVAKKLACGLDEPFRTQVVDIFNQTVMRDSCGCDSTTLDTLQSAVATGNRLKIYYQSSRDWKTTWREVDPLRVYFLQRYMYLYARTQEKSSPFRVFRVSRIKEIQKTGIFFDVCVDDGGFYKKLSNAFNFYIGESSREVKIRFKGAVIPFVVDTEWHHSQKIEWENTGSIIFSVQVAEPKEVIWWAKQFDGEVVCGN
ncbi:helix-turn-helix transcriptional regulator, partial [Desulfovibrio sp. TomC]|uniref:helix-turn-helix transcriptional regulator n=1 Tax=Desulfovibrio sp. TomC TaxID=1562888 RepID=UPI001E6282CB